MPLYTEEQRRKAEDQVDRRIPDFPLPHDYRKCAVDTQLALNDAEERLREAERLLLKWMIREDDPADLGAETTAWLRRRGEKGAKGE